MKELSIEEKARCYDEAIETAKTIYKRSSLYSVEDALISIFSELKELEDNRWRNWLIAHLEGYISQTDDKYAEVCKKAIAWLEKHGEQKVSVVEFNAKDWYVSKVDGKIYNAKFMKKASTNLARKLEIEKAAMSATGIIDREEWFIKGAEWADGNPSYISSEKQGEQNPAWSEEDENMLDRAIYMMEQLDMTKSWDDVYNWLKSLKDRVQPRQEWKQENINDLTDFENAMMHIGGSFFGENAGLDPNDTNAIKEQANLLLELVPKQEWSDEDEKFFKTALWHISYSISNGESTDIHCDTTNWLKSLKQRIGG